MLDYKTLITEDVETLLACERRQKYSKLSTRVHMLRLLKSGQARSLAAVAPLIDLSAAEARSLFKKYRTEGLKEFVRWRYGGNRGKLTAEQQQQLVMSCAEAPNRFASQADLEHYILQTFQVSYSQPGISKLCSRNKIKHKVGRPRNNKSDEQQHQEYKKNSVGP